MSVLSDLFVTKEALKISQVKLIKERLKYTKVKLAEHGQPKPAEIRQVKSIITKKLKVIKSQGNLTISQYF